LTGIFPQTIDRRQDRKDSREFEVLQQGEMNGPELTMLRWEKANQQRHGKEERYSP
jgi:hypothetical protein